MPTFASKIQVYEAWSSKEEAEIYIDYMKYLQAHSRMNMNRIYTKFGVFLELNTSYLFFDAILMSFRRIQFIPLYVIWWELVLNKWLLNCNNK